MQKKHTLVFICIVTSTIFYFTLYRSITSTVLSKNIVYNQTSSLSRTELQPTENVSYDVPYNSNDLFEVESPRWITIRNQRYGLFAFSAFYDEIYSTNPVVRIIGVGKQRHNEGKIACMLTYKGSKNQITKGYVNQIRQWGITNYTAKWIVCPLPNTDVPKTVSLITNASFQNSFNVNYMKKFTRGTPGTINVCVRTLFGPYKNSTKLVEFIEFYRLLGATHFTFFKKNVSRDVSIILEYYRKEGVATIFKYDLPSTIYIKPEGQYAIIQDCLLRSRGVYQYVAFVDLDEFIIPRQHGNLLDLLDIAEQKYKISSGFIFRSLIHCKEFKRNKTVQSYLTERAVGEVTNGDQFELLTQLLTKRSKKPCPGSAKAKTIIKPWNVTEMNVHNIRKSVKGLRSFIVSENLALCHHYRICPNHSYDNWRNPCPPLFDSVEDVGVHKYLRNLTSNVIKIFKKLYLKFT